MLHLIDFGPFRIKRSLESGHLIDTNLKREALSLVDKIQWEDKGPELAVAFGGEEGGGGGSHEDDEYRY